MNELLLMIEPKIDRAMGFGQQAKTNSAQIETMARALNA